MYCCLQHDDSAINIVLVLLLLLKTGFSFVDCFLGCQSKGLDLFVVVPVSLKVFMGKMAPCNGPLLAARAIVEEGIALARRTLAGGGCPLGYR